MALLPDADWLTPACVKGNKQGVVGWRRHQGVRGLWASKHEGSFVAAWTICAHARACFCARASVCSARMTPFKRADTHGSQSHHFHPCSQPMLMLERSLSTPCLTATIPQRLSVPVGPPSPLAPPRCAAQPHTCIRMRAARRSQAVKMVITYTSESAGGMPRRSATKSLSTEKRGSA